MTDTWLRAEGLGWPTIVASRSTIETPRLTIVAPLSTIVTPRHTIIAPLSKILIKYKV